MKIRIKNWTMFQHYKNRRPPWIKLHHNLLDDYVFHCLPDASRAIAPLLWLLASENLDGSIDMDWDGIAFRLHSTSERTRNACIPLADKGFIDIDSDPLAACEQLAPKSLSEVETEKEVETETEGEGKSAPTPAIVSAFASMKCEPFGSVKFKSIWVEEWLSESQDGYSDAMERCIQRCKGLGVEVPGRFYTMKREVEKTEAVAAGHEMRRRTPL